MASKLHIVTEIEALENHFMRPVRQPDHQERWLRDYIEDLQEFSDDIISAACKRWRQSGAPKFPNAGQLRAICQQMTPPQGQDRPEPWRPLSDEEYAKLSLREKIRHHQILAHEARGRAGPMWRNAKPVPADEMPGTWRAWLDRAASHDAEVQRLRPFMRTEDRRA